MTNKSVKPLIARFAGAEQERELLQEELEAVSGAGNRLTLQAKMTQNDWGPATRDGSELTSND